MLILILIAIYIIWFIIKNILKDQKNHKVGLHVENLKIGGLIPRVEREIHDAAMRRIGIESPNIKLPRREYFNASDD